MNNKKVQDTLRLEISFYDSRLEVLYSELANLKSAFDIYQRFVSVYIDPISIVKEIVNNRRRNLVA